MGSGRVVQQAFEAVIESPEPEALLASAADARRWLATRTRNLARNHRRLHAVSRPHLSDETTLESLASESDLESAVADVDELLRFASCLRTLGATQREVVRLRLLEERHGENVARQLRLSRGHIAVLLHRARANLRICMGTAPRL